MNKRMIELIEQRAELLAEIMAFHSGTIEGQDRWVLVNLTGQLSDLEIMLVREMQKDAAACGIRRTFAECAAEVPGMVASFGTNRRANLLDAI